MWLSCLLILVAILCWQMWSAGPRRALGVIVVLSLLVPTWVVLQVVGLPIHMRAAAGVIGLAAYCICPSATINWRLGTIDLIGLALLAVHILSDWINDGLNWTVPLRAYGEWAVPFLAGRLALQSIDDVRKLLPFVLAVTVVFAAAAGIESFSGVNLFESVVGNRPVEQFSRNASRMGIKRAFGPAMHPIYFGSLQALLFAWTLYASSRSRRGAGPKWWRWTPWLTACGVFLTVSRAPLLALAVTLYATAVITLPAYRKALLGLGAVGIVSAALGWNSLLDALHLWGGELRHFKRNHPTVTIENEKRPISSTLTRVYFFEIYSLAMRRAGLLGFGTERTTGFPPRVPVGPQHAETLKRIWTLDNAYILLILRFGYLGCLAFVALGLAAVLILIRRSTRRGAAGSVFLAAVAGSILAQMLVLLTVWLPHDFGFWLLWSIGAASGLSAEHQLSASERTI